jgi:hypothetical protein
MAMKMPIVVFWVVIPCGLVGGYWFEQATWRMGDVTVLGNW